MRSAMRPVVVAGPSGSGKSTLISRLLKEFPSSFGFSVSHTTRKPRPGEQNGVHYFFTDRETFLKEREEGKFLESAEYSGNLYGTSIAAVESVAEQGKVCLLDIDIQGVLSVKQSTLNARYLFVVPPSVEELRRRLTGRGDTDAEAIEKRLDTAKRELEYRDKPDFWDKVIVNDDLESAYQQFRTFLTADTGSSSTSN
ncbi:guanylate kinase [Balamuthia mandrillaris]